MVENDTPGPYSEVGSPVTNDKHVNLMRYPVTETALRVMSMALSEDVEMQDLEVYKHSVFVRSPIR